MLICSTLKEQVKDVSSTLADVLSGLLQKLPASNKITQQGRKPEMKQMKQYLNSAMTRQQCFCCASFLQYVLPKTVASLLYPYELADEACIQLAQPGRCYHTRQVTRVLAATRARSSRNKRRKQKIYGVSLV